MLCNVELQRALCRDPSSPDFLELELTHATNVYGEPPVCPAPSRPGAPHSTRDTNAYPHGDNDQPMTSLILARRSGCGSIWKPSLATFFALRRDLRLHTCSWWSCSLQPDSSWATVCLTSGWSLQAWGGVFSLTKAGFLGSMPFYIRVLQGLRHLQKISSENIY